MTAFISTSGTLFHMAATASLLFVALVAFSAAHRPRPPEDPYDYPDHDDY